MKREDTIKLHLKNFLAGKSEKKRAEFMAKDLNKQYATIMAWKRREEMKKAANGVTVGEILKHIKGLQTLIPMANAISNSQAKGIEVELNKTIEILKNYNQERTMREIEELERQKNELAQKIELLRTKC